MIDVIIIGAGAAGLTAARHLSERGKSVLLIEARNRVGGRIHTFHSEDFSAPLEAGAEFIHGKLPHTTALLDEARIEAVKGEGNMWNIHHGKIDDEGNVFDEGFDDVVRKLKSLSHDMTIADFLRKYFADAKYEALRENITRFVSGYDAADPEKASAFALRDEWSSDEDLTGYHPTGGYGRLMEFLQRKCVEQGVDILLDEVVTEIRWGKNNVEVVTSKSTYASKKILITIPPAVLKKDHVKFHPPIPEHRNALEKIETGGVIKFLVEFHEAFWEKENSGVRFLPGMHFLFSDAIIPTWWTLKPNPIPLLTGWLGGPITQRVSRSKDDLEKNCLDALSYLLDCSREELLKKIRAIKIINWVDDPFSFGAYAYKTVETNDALKILTKPIEETIYFAGEAYYDGAEMGTVEAALACGRSITRQIET